MRHVTIQGTDGSTGHPSFKQKTKKKSPDTSEAPEVPQAPEAPQTPEAAPEPPVQTSSNSNKIDTATASNSDAYLSTIATQTASINLAKSASKSASKSKKSKPKQSKSIKSKSKKSKSAQVAFTRSGATASPVPAFVDSDLAASVRLAVDIAAVSWDPAASKLFKAAIAPPTPMETDELEDDDFDFDLEDEQIPAASSTSAPNSASTASTSATEPPDETRDPGACMLTQFVPLQLVAHTNEGRSCGKSHVIWDNKKCNSPTSGKGAFTN